MATQTGFYPPGTYLGEVDQDAALEAADHDPSMPGKFEREPAWVVYYWLTSLNGSDGELIYPPCECEGDECLCKPLGELIEITDGERRLFPELGNATRVEIIWNDQGFVSGFARGTWRP